MTFRSTFTFARSVTCVAVFAALGGAAMAQDITGAGATFPAPIYAKWADAYNKASGIRVNYQSVGSGAGIQQIRAKTVDFGASDMPLKPEESMSSSPSSRSTIASPWSRTTCSRRRAARITPRFFIWAS